ncbi:MAG: Cytochrome c family protein [bacterium]|nr:MAG: Cytochrome c family protein [bacterium]TXT18124.1 MAG: Cytochrome c family protein [bacterium]
MNTIPPKGHRIAKYAFKLPSDAKRIKVEARLNYMSHDQAVADKLLGKGAVKVPMVETKALARAYGADLKAIEAPQKLSRR